MTGNRTTTPDHELIVVDIELSDEQHALVDSLAASASTSAHEVTRSDVLRTIVEEGMEHTEGGIAQLPKPSA